MRKEHLYGGIAILVAAGAFYFQDKADRTDESMAREANVASCVREVTRDAYEASAFLTLSDRVGRRGNPGDQESSRRYKAAALSIADTFPKPETSVGGEEMIQVQFVSGPGDLVRFRLTDEAESLIQQGCERAF